tara:strand:- start:405 stop:533 length:129 start_codon:yes stop_codon:yes gene_type:complete
LVKSSSLISIDENWKTAWKMFSNGEIVEMFSLKEKDRYLLTD